MLHTSAALYNDTLYTRPIQLYTLYIRPVHVYTISTLYDFTLDTLQLSTVHLHTSTLYVQLYVVLLLNSTHFRLIFVRLYISFYLVPFYTVYVFHIIVPCIVLKFTVDQKKILIGLFVIDEVYFVPRFSPPSENR
jgi:hypothetical protein